MSLPILLLIYNRPEHTRQVLSTLTELGVKQLYVAADGPKDQGDKTLCEAARTECMESGIELITHFNQQHLGCRMGVVRGLNWFFGLHEKGIVLEDDCLPNATFLHFCQVLLERHKEDQSVYMISGNNPLGVWQTGESHHFARIGHIWGWATWRDRWQDFDVHLPELERYAEHGGFIRAFGNIGFAQQLERNARLAISGEVDTWDFQWTLHHAMKGRLAAIPSENLVQNIGFDHTATHTDERPTWLSEHVAHDVAHISSPPVRPDRSYEMQLYAARCLNRLAPPAPAHFKQLGLDCKRKLRVVLVNTTDAGGGAEAMAMQLLHELRTLGHDALLLVQEKQTDDEHVVVMAHAPVTQMVGLRPDVVHVHNLHGCQLTLEQLSHLSISIPVVWTLHDAWLTTGNSRHPFLLDANGASYLDRIEWNQTLDERNKYLKNADITFTSPSQWMCDRLLNAHGRAAHFVTNQPLLPPPADVAPPATDFMLFVSNHAERNPYRELDVLLAAWEMANSTLDAAGIDLLCIGGREDKRHIGNATYRMLERQTTETVLAYMEHAVALVQASTQDNAPLTIMEAHHVGTPVIGAMVGGIPEMVCQEEADLLYATGDVATLADSILRAFATKSALRDAVGNFFRMNEDEHGMAHTFIGHYLTAMQRG